MLCVNCKKETLNPKFCSRSCSASYTNSKHPKRKRVSSFCVNCSKKLNYTQYKFCSIYCTNEHKKKQTILKLESGIYLVRGKVSPSVREFILRRAEYKCEVCGWKEVNPFSNITPLDIHHIDGNRNNNYLDNLQVLCPNCHSLTKNYKFLNRNN